MNTSRSRYHTVLKRVALLFGLLFTVGLILVACGGGDSRQSQPTEATATAVSADGKKEALAVPPGWVGRAPSSEVINGVAVPPEPAPSVNNATLAGVDSNKNGVRDDVERLVAKAVSGPEFFASAIVLTRGHQTMLTAPLFNQQVYDAEYQKILCAAAKLPDTFDDTRILKATINTAERRKLYMTRMSTVSGRFYDEDAECK